MGNVLISYLSAISEIRFNLCDLLFWICSGGLEIRMHATHFTWGLRTIMTQLLISTYFMWIY